LVTGAAGFIGSHVVEALLSRGDEVVGLDNFDPYYDPARKRANLAEVAAHPQASRFRFVEGSITDRQLLQGLFGDFAPERVVHLAAMAGVRASMEQPHRYFETNLTGTLNLLEVARPTRSPLVMASTSSVYGNCERLPFREEEAADRPLAPYAASKRAAELLGHTYHHLYGIPFTALRFFTVYGPRNRPDMMAFKVVDALLRDKELPLYEGGQMLRDWTYVDDTVSGIVAAAERPQGYQVMNLGRGEPVLLLDFVRSLEKRVGKTARFSSKPRPDTDAQATHADITLARERLGYAPQVSVGEGVERFWAWYQRAGLAR
jgi:UDP-glucuronate 4-epimerase